jgi:hypothetical protein
MSSKRFSEAWSTLADSLRRSRNTVVLAFRIPPEELDYLCRWYRRQWPDWASMSETSKMGVTGAAKLAYRRAARTGAWLALRDEQISARIRLGTIAIGLLGAGTGWIWLIAATSARGVAFAVSSAAVFLINAFLVAPAAAHTPNPWRRLGELSVVWAALSIGLFAAARWPALTSWFQRAPSMFHVLSFATGSVALFCLLGALFARIASFTVNVTISWQRLHRYPEVTALMQAVELIAGVRKEKWVTDILRRRWMIQRLDLLSRCVGQGIPSLLAMPRNGSGDIARDRFRQAAAVILGYQSWIALPAPETRDRLLARLSELAMILLTGHYDSLPAETDFAAPAHRSQSRAVTHYIGGVVAAVFPLAVVLLWSMFGFALPDYVRQWLTGFAIVWFIAKLLQLLDPASGKIWEQVSATVGSPQTPGKP